MSQARRAFFVLQTRMKEPINVTEKIREKAQRKEAIGWAISRVGTNTSQPSKKKVRAQRVKDHLCDPFYEDAELWKDVVRIEPSVLPIVPMKLRTAHPDVFRALLK